MDAYSFSDVLCGKFGDYFTVIPDSNEDIYTFKVIGGYDSRNALLVSTIISNIIKLHFPGLQRKKDATQYAVQICIGL